MFDTRPFDSANWPTTWGAAPATDPISAPATDPAPPLPGAEEPTATPAARALATAHGLDLGQVAGTGREGHITVADVRAALAAAAGAGEE